MYTVEDGGECVYSFCEVYLNADGSLKQWTRPLISPAGESVDEVLAVLGAMHLAAEQYKAVYVEDLKVGMEFESLGDSSG